MGWPGEVGEDRWASPVMRSCSGTTGHVLDFTIKIEKNNRGKNFFLGGRKKIFVCRLMYLG